MEEDADRFLELLGERKEEIKENGFQQQLDIENSITSKFIDPTSKDPLDFIPLIGIIHGLKRLSNGRMPNDNNYRLLHGVYHGLITTAALTSFI